MQRLLVTINSMIALFFFTPVLLNAATLLQESKIHDDSIDDICMAGDQLYTASFDRKIKHTNFHISEEIGSHKDWVRAILCIDDNIVSASNDGYIIIWKDNKILNKVKAHDWWITDLAFGNNKIVSVSLDETVRVWSYPELEKLYEYKIFGSDKHHSVVVHNNVAYIGSTTSISALNLTNYKWLFKSIPIHNFNTVYAIVTHQDDIFFSDSDGNIYHLDKKQRRVRIMLTLDHFAIKAMAVHDDTLYIGNDAGKIYQISLSNFKNYSLIQKSPQAVRSILVKDDILYAAYDDGIIRSFKTSR